MINLVKRREVFTPLLQYAPFLGCPKFGSATLSAELAARRLQFCLEDVEVKTVFCMAPLHTTRACQSNRQLTQPHWHTSMVVCLTVTRNAKLARQLGCMAESCTPNNHVTTIAATTQKPTSLPHAALPPRHLAVPRLPRPAGNPKHGRAHPC